MLAVRMCPKLGHQAAHAGLWRKDDRAASPACTALAVTAIQLAE